MSRQQSEHRSHDETYHFTGQRGKTQMIRFRNPGGGVRTGSTYGVIIFVLILSGSGCDMERRRLMKEEYPSYPERIRRAIDRNSVMRGMTEEQVYLALGSPVCKKDIQREGRPVRV